MGKLVGAQDRDHLVRRLRFDLDGGLYEECLFATESELGGLREQQLELGIGPGEQPLPTAGPLFALLEKGDTDDNADCRPHP